MNKHISSKVVVISGVSSGLGEAIALKILKSKNFKVIGLGRHNSLNLPSNSESYEFMQVDLNFDHEITKVTTQIFQKYKKIDVHINNAGFAFKGTVSEIDIIEVKEQFQVNLFGTMLLTQLIVREMKKQNSGHIINISSLGSKINTPTLGYYAASKAALDKISQILTLELLKHNIYVSTIAPGTIKSKFGKNIKNSKNLGIDGDENIYKEWDTRFRNFFTKNQTPEQIAEIVVKRINNPQIYSYTNFRDRLISLSTILPFRVHYWILTKFFLKS